MTRSSTSRTPATKTSLKSRVFGWMSLAVVGALAITACTDGTQAPLPTANPSSQTLPGQDPADNIVAGFEEYYTQEVAWEKCDGGTFHCATVRAPMDWADPSSESIELAIKLYSARGKTAMGTILTNPGGPGASGLDLVSYAPLMFGQKLLENYNILGWDPRGVGQSSAVTCLDAPEMDAYLAMSFDTSRPQALEVMQTQADKFAAACQENTGELLGHVDTQSSAKDMDLLRALMGDEKLNYLGFSYGTQLGGTYAGLFPQNVGRLVLDGAIDLRLTPFEQSKQQAVGFENALRAWATDCFDASECPVAGDVDQVMQSVADLFEQLLSKPMTTSDPDRRLTQSLAFYGVAQPLYAEELWPVLNDALYAAFQENDGSGLLSLADQYFGRDEDGTFADNQTEAFTAVNCLDDRASSDYETMQMEAKEIEEAAPVMGSSFGFGGIGCKNWPYPVAEKTFDLAAQGAAPIMVIGTTNDPATPYVWAQGLAEQLDSGFLVTYEGEGHTAYGRGSTCIMDTVDNYFVDGTVPASDPLCTR